MGCVYLATNLVNGKQYVGKTIQKLSTRISQHITHNQPTQIHRALLKYGKDKFRWEILYTTDDDVRLFERETFFIITLCTISPYGYNVVLEDGRLGRDAHGKPPRPVYCVETDSRHESIALAAMELNMHETTIRYKLSHPRYARKGYHFCDDNEKDIQQIKEEYTRGFPKADMSVPEERRKRTSATLKKIKKLTPEAAKALQASALRHYNSLSEEEKAERTRKIDETKRRTNAWNEISVRNVETGVVYPSMLKAREAYSPKKGHMIGRCCAGFLKTAYGFHWEYASKEGVLNAS
jgi:hypothetical protein